MILHCWKHNYPTIRISEMLEAGYLTSRLYAKFPAVTADPTHGLIGGSTFTCHWHVVHE